MIWLTCNESTAGLAERFLTEIGQDQTASDSINGNCTVNPLVNMKAVNTMVNTKPVNTLVKGGLVAACLLLVDAVADGHKADHAFMAAAAHTTCHNSHNNLNNHHNGKDDCKTDCHMASLCGEEPLAPPMTPAKFAPVGGNVIISLLYHYLVLLLFHLVCFCVVPFCFLLHDSVAFVLLSFAFVSHSLYFRLFSFYFILLSSHCFGCYGYDDYIRCWTRRGLRQGKARGGCAER
jgi:hypothetical protein